MELSEPIKLPYMFQFYIEACVTNTSLKNEHLQRTPKYLLVHGINVSETDYFHYMSL
jgi:hypothetical protein